MKCTVNKLKNKNKNKYGAIKTYINGIRFDSKLEASFYLPIKKFCDSHGLQLELQKRMKIYEVMGKPYYYVADFLISNNGKSFLIDAKGYQISSSIKKISIACNLYHMNSYVGSSIILALKGLKEFYNQSVKVTKE